MFEHASTVPVQVMTGVALVTGLNRLFIYQKRKFPEDLAFSVSCLVFCIYALACAGLYSAPKPNWEPLGNDFNC
jgi:hypothetical protein